MSFASVCRHLRFPCEHAASWDALRSKLELQKIAENTENSISNRETRSIRKWLTATVIQWFTERTVSTRWRTVEEHPRCVQLEQQTDTTDKAFKALESKAITAAAGLCELKNPDTVLANSLQPDLDWNPIYSDAAQSCSERLRTDWMRLFNSLTENFSVKSTRQEGSKLWALVGQFTKARNSTRVLQQCRVA